MRKIYADGGWLHYPPLEFYYTQGEENVEPVRFILPQNREEVDLTALSYQLKAVSEAGTEAVWMLPKKLSEEHILLDWKITREFTAIPGRTLLVLTGTDSKNTVVAKWTGEPAQIREDPKGAAPVPPPDKLEQFESQVNQAVEKITGALENADYSLDEMLPVLDEAKQTADTLLQKSDKLQQSVNVLENQTIPQFTVYVDKQKQSIDVAVLNAQNSAKSAKESASEAESSRQSTEQIQQVIAKDSEMIRSLGEKASRDAQIAVASSEKAVAAANTATGAANATAAQAKTVEARRKETEQLKSAAEEAIKHYPRINADSWWEIYNPTTERYEQTKSRAQLMPRGIYSKTKTYFPMDIVTDETAKASYLALKQSTGMPLDNVDIWLKLVEAIKGDKGDIGKGLSVLAQYRTLAELKIAVPNAEQGDAYSVGTQAPYEIYIWQGKKWVSHGYLEGPKGDKGDPGIKGDNGKSAYEYAQEAGYTDTQEQFGKDLNTVSEKIEMQIKSLTLLATSWSAVENTAELYKQTITQKDILSKVVADRTALDLHADVSVKRMLREQGIIEIWLENQDGKVFAYVEGEAPQTDVTVQVRIMG